MDKLFEIKGQLSVFYTKYSRYINRVLRFIVALLTFTFINKNIGFSTMIANPFVTIAVAIICTFLPPVMIMLYAILAILVHLYTVSLGLAIVSAALFLIVYAAYLRFVPGQSMIVLVTLITYMIKAPVLAPIAFGLVGGPTYIIAMSIGTVFYFTVNYVKSYATLIGTVAETGMMEQITAYAQQMFANKAMWITIVSYGLVLIIVYYLRKLEVDHAWKVAIGAGALSNIIIMALSNVMMDIPIAYGELIVGSIIAVIIALVMEFFLFSVDYTRTEYLQFEDEEYYYYVKAVPKMKVAIPEKTVKRINERQETEEEKTEEPVKTKTKEEDDSEIDKIIEEELKK